MIGQDIIDVSCTDKHAFHRRQQAVEVMERQLHNTSTKLNVYKCDICDKWHIGTIIHLSNIDPVKKQNQAYKRLKPKDLMHHLDDFYED